jgi:hypothetical protein
MSEMVTPTISYINRVYFDRFESQSRRLSKVSFLSKPLGKRPILIGLSIHFALWWAALIVWRWPNTSWKDAVEIAIPPTGAFSIFFSGGFRELGAIGILISFALIGMTLLSVRKRRCWVVLLTHLAVLLYWLYMWVSFEPFLFFKGP